ncbi:hypothetical protein CBR_g45215 [Chara braunii]|uniref:Reverse transcriptase domain-containing protein n=1 Tax=Chara braunii TaxID=69332 RepID=A0A388K3D9_CHABU|nr:hypothetical protein CBR_g45215 [Chara braunii]|eukprot:GBG64519.1 hypothetical protein CBR_g45215 [Chara braunii]
MAGYGEHRDYGGNYRSSGRGDRGSYEREESAGGGSDRGSAGRLSFNIYSSGGNIWQTTWKAISKAFGSTKLTLGSETRTLKHCKAWLEGGGRFAVEYLVQWKPQCRYLKDTLTRLLRQPNSLTNLYKWGMRSLLRLYNAAKDFTRKSTRKYLRRLIARVFLRKFDLSLSADLLIKIKFDDRLRLCELRKVVNDLLMTCDLPTCFLGRARKKARIVWQKNQTVGELLHNHRAFAARPVLTCSCAGLPYPRVDGHVQFRLNKDMVDNPLLANARNIPKVSITNRVKLLSDEIRVGFQSWRNLQGVLPTVSEGMLAECFMDCKAQSYSELSVDEVHAAKKRFDGLVLTPLDRNPGETVVMCPMIYYQAMISTFVLNPGYTIMQVNEGVVLRELREDVNAAGLRKFAKWEGKGRIGSAYVIPKHKDLTRYRPICPTYLEPMVRTGRVVARGLNFLLGRLPRGSHFNLPAVSQLTSALGRINSSINQRRRVPDVKATSYDIKDMFSRLPHQEILRSLSWLLDFHKMKGRSFVRVNTRGKGSSFGRTTGADHWRLLLLDEVFEFVRIELQHTYTFATSVLLRKDVGIPMGKTTSPPLACTLCAFFECMFLRSLGKYGRQVFGIRLVDDVILVRYVMYTMIGLVSVGWSFSSGNADGARSGGMIKQGCYPL